jgi:hypothetical protein
LILGYNILSQSSIIGDEEMRNLDISKNKKWDATMLHTAKKIGID